MSGFQDTYMRHLRVMAETADDALDASVLKWALRELSTLRALAAELAAKGITPAT